MTEADESPTSKRLRILEPQEIEALYIDSPPLRQNVQRALNRGENYNQLRRAVAYANFGKCGSRRRTSRCCGASAAG
jgi:TnpA family transposase